MLKILQLDLARQKETLEFVKEMFKFASDNGYNAIQLYLEAGIRTPSFCFADPDKSYSEDEMRELVDFAAKCNLEIIPAFNTLGHCELFLENSELVGLSEQWDQPEDVRRSEFCPSNPDVYVFLKNFLSEVADIFPGNYFHIGCDEVFRMASCPTCRERLANGETHAQIFAKHIEKVNEICKSFGKKAVMWDDMADFFPELLDILPRDIVQVYWEYNAVVEDKQTKYGNRRRLNILKCFEDRNTPFWVAPREILLSNLLTISEYAEKYQTTGMLMTVWEHAKDFMYAFLPNIAFAGRWWSRENNSDYSEVASQTVTELFGIDYPDFTAAVMTFTSLENIRNPLEDGNSFFHSPTPATYPEITSRIFCESVLQKYESEVTTELGRKIINDMLVNLRYSQILLDAQLWINRLYHGDAQVGFAEIEKRFMTLIEERKQQWLKWRSGLSAAKFQENLEKQLSVLREYKQNRQQAEGYLELRLLLPDQYGRETLIAEIAGKNEEWEAVFSGIPKPNYSGEQPFYRVYTPLRSIADLTKLKLTATGDNGICIVFVAIHSFNGKKFVPESIISQDGLFDNTEAFFIDDTTWCFCGNHDGHEALWNKQMNARKHVIEFQMKRGN